MDKKTKLYIDKLRKEIDDFDSRILELINQRLVIANEIGKIKEEKGARVLDKSRENRIFKRLKSLNKGPLNEYSLHHIYAEIMAISRDIQTPWVISFLGPELSFTHTAAMNHFGHSLLFVPQNNNKGVFHEVARRACRFGVLPIENSMEGTLNNTLDLFIESDLKICAELYQAVSYDLLSMELNNDEIETLYFQVRTYDECRMWVEKNMKNVGLHPCKNQMEAILKTKTEKRSAAIAGRGLGQIHDLNVLEAGIEDAPGNVMRFIVIGKESILRTGKDKTSIMFVTPHVPGGLYRVLEPVAQAGLNMVKLESRPTRHENWQYLFFADIEGHMKDPEVKETIGKMKKICLHLKYLGSYPRVNGVI